MRNTRQEDMARAVLGLRDIRDGRERIDTIVNVLGKMRHDADSRAGDFDV